jgi:NADP-dependent 3-hydroxy acid dehydrogenase YdfG
MVTDGSIAGQCGLPTFAVHSMTIIPQKVHSDHASNGNPTAGADFAALSRTAVPASAPMVAASAVLKHCAAQACKYCRCDGGMGKLEGKVALVTGSGRNIGRATVLKLAGEGAHVVVNARSNQQEIETVAREARDLGVKAVPVLADVGKKAEVEALAARALSEFGRVDILINNAAIRPHKPFTETTDADWESIRSVVLDGPLYLTRALIEPMVRDRYGRILFFVGDGSISASGSGRTHLSAAKMGLIGMARGLAS